jgi:RsiW-degrading membrane proteinase PrsW (M82 family)
MIIGHPYEVIIAHNLTRAITIIYEGLSKSNGRKENHQTSAGIQTANRGHASPCLHPQIPIHFSRAILSAPDMKPDHTTSQQIIIGHQYEVMIAHVATRAINIAYEAYQNRMRKENNQKSGIQTAHGHASPCLHHQIYLYQQYKPSRRAYYVRQGPQIVWPRP